MQSNQHLVIDFKVLIPCIDFSKTKNFIPTDNSDQPGAKADQSRLLTALKLATLVKQLNMHQIFLL